MTSSFSQRQTFSVHADQQAFAQVFATPLAITAKYVLPYTLPILELLSFPNLLFSSLFGYMSNTD